LSRFGLFVEFVESKMYGDQAPPSGLPSKMKVWFRL
jgi:hypothetical protein